MATFKEYVLSDLFKSLSELYISAAKSNAIDREKNELKESLFSFLLSTGHQQREKGTTTDGEYEREPIIAELIHEALCHATMKGLNQTDTILLAQSLLEGLEWIKNKDEFCELEEDLKSLLQSLSASFTTHHGQQVTTQYLIQTLLLQPNLYHYLMNEEQERDMTYLELTLYSSSLLPPLTEGTTEEEWHRKERVACVDTQYELQKNQLISEKESSLSEEKDKLGKLYGDLNDSFEDDEKVDQEELKTVLGPLVLGHVSGMKTELLLKLKEQEMNIAHQIDRMKAWKGEKRTTTPDKQQ